MLHWSFALPFLICYCTALILIVVYNPDPMRPYREIVSWAHRISGICLLSLPPLVLLTHPRDFKIHMNNIKEGWIWTWGDIKWLALMPLSVISKKVSLPEEGKFNAGEKINFMNTMATIPLYGATGILIWQAQDAALPWLLHFAMALLATPMLGVHLFMAIINPGTRKALPGMFSGYVDRQWAAHHYRRWFKENFGAPTKEVFDTEWNDSSTVAELILGQTGQSEISEIAGKETDVDNRRPARRPTRTQIAVRTGLALSPATVAFVVLMAAAIFSAGFYVAGPSTDSTVYVDSDRPLLSRPAAGAENTPGGTLMRGASVTVLERKNSFVLVQDIRGRTGYIPPAALVEERPRLEPDKHGFPDCYRGQNEPDGAACQQRAGEARDRCLAECGTDANCSEQCDAHHMTCGRRCDPMAATEADSSSTPPAEEPTAVAEEPTAAAETPPTPSEATSPPVKSKRKQKTKKRRKKGRKANKKRRR